MVDLGLNGLSPEESTHFTYNYGGNETWNVLFPSFSDVALGLDTFPKEAWDLQSDWYLTQIQELGLPFAGPVDDFQYIKGPFNWGLTDWSKSSSNFGVWPLISYIDTFGPDIVAASVSSEAVQQAVIETTHAFLTNGKNSIPFGTKYAVTGPQIGQWLGNKNRASVGSHFALLALKQSTWYR